MSFENNEMIKPVISSKTCETIMKSSYGLICVKIQELNGYDDKNYKVLVDEFKTENPYITNGVESGYVLKIFNSLSSQNQQLIEAQTALLLYLNQNGIRCPMPVRNKFGEYTFFIDLEKNKHIVTLLEYIPGKILHEIPISKLLAFQIGCFAGKMNFLLQKFDCTSAYKSFSSVWTLNSIPQLREILHHVSESNKRELFTEIIDEFEETVLNNRNKLKEGLIHGDINEQNIVVNKTENDEWEMNALIDFGDCNFSYYLFEIAIAMTYIMMIAKDLDFGGYVLAGYLKHVHLTEFEISLLKISIEARLTQSLVIGNYSYLRDPGNHYLLVTAETGWNLLENLRNESNETLTKRWKNIVLIKQAFKINQKPKE